MRARASIETRDAVCTQMYPIVEAFARQLVILYESPLELEDLVQEGMLLVLKAYVEHSRRWEKGQPIYRFHTLCMNEYVRPRLEALVSMEATKPPPESIDAAYEDWCSRLATPALGSARLEVQELKLRARWSMSSLTPRQAQIFWLYYFSGLGHRDIGRVTGLRGTARVSKLVQESRFKVRQRFLQSIANGLTNEQLGGSLDW